MEQYHASMKGSLEGGRIAIVLQNRAVGVTSTPLCLHTSKSVLPTRCQVRPQVATGSSTTLMHTSMFTAALATQNFGLALTYF